jgi:ketosteroid isomerase-like protein
MTTPATGFDFEALRRGTEERDADVLADLYAEDAEILTVNKNAPPSRPQVVRGREEISEVLRDVCAREMTHRVENEIVGEDRVAFTEQCRYPDGVRVLTAVTMEVRDGKILRQVNVEAWDE